MDHNSSLWTPDSDAAVQGKVLEDVTKAYCVFLEVCDTNQHADFLKRLRSDPDAANAEAAIFSWMRAKKLAPSLNEKPGQGGVDFLCSSPDGNQFLIEVTAIRKDAVVNKSGWPDCVDGVAQAFSMITTQLSNKGQHKAGQLATGQAVPRVLVISLAHPGASTLLCPHAAELLMASDPTVTVPIVANGMELGATRLMTNFKRSVFFGLKNGAIVPMRESISAILLVAISDRQLHVVGMLHPKPTVPLDHRNFARVPFLRVGWPLTSPINMEWVVGEPTPLRADHIVVQLADEELKGKTH